MTVIDNFIWLSLDPVTSLAIKYETASLTFNSKDHNSRVNLRNINDSRDYPTLPYSV